MRNRYLILLLLFFPIVLYSTGKAEIPENFNDINVVKNISEKGRFWGISLSLPYQKPLGIEKVYITDMASISIEKLIVNGQIVKPKLEWASAIEAISEIWDEDVDSSEKKLLRDMVWDSSSWDNDIYFISWPHFEKSNPYRYLIKEGAKEVYMTYKILFPDGEETESYTVRWEMSWEDINR